VDGPRQGSSPSLADEPWLRLILDRKFANVCYREAIFCGEIR
jgi:hypothetical protein